MTNFSNELICKITASLLKQLLAEKSDITTQFRAKTKFSDVKCCRAKIDNIFNHTNTLQVFESFQHLQKLFVFFGAEKLSPENILGNTAHQ